MFGFLKSMFKSNRLTDTNLNKIYEDLMNEHSYLQNIGKNEPLSILLDRVVEKYNDEDSELIKNFVYDKLNSIFNHTEDRLNNSNSKSNMCVKSIINDIVKSSIDINRKNVKECVEILKNSNKLEHNLIAYTVEKVDIESFFSDWVKQAEIKDTKMKDSFYNLSLIGILDRKKEKNRIFLKYSGVNISSKLNDIVSQRTDKDIEKTISFIEHNYNKFLVEIEKDSVLFQISKPVKADYNYYDVFFESDFFGYGKGQYPISKTPLIPFKFYICGTFEGYDTKEYSTEEYENELSKHNLISFGDVFEKCNWW